MAKVYNVDELASEYQPLEIVFRGESYVLGATVQDVLDGLKLANEKQDDSAEDVLLELLPSVLGALSKPLGERLKSMDSKLTLGECMVLKKAVEATFEQIGKVPFRPQGE